MRGSHSNWIYEGKFRVGVYLPLSEGKLSRDSLKERTRLQSPFSSHPPTPGPQGSRWMTSRDEKRKSKCQTEATFSIGHVLFDGTCTLYASLHLTFAFFCLAFTACRHFVYTGLRFFYLLVGGGQVLCLWCEVLGLRRILPRTGGVLP